jgi:hypothetical protein
VNVTPARRPGRAAAVRLDLARLTVAATFFAIAFDHGGYTTEQQTRIGIVVWWLLVVAVLAGTSRLRVSLLGIVALASMTAFAVLELASVFWSHDATSAFVELDRVMAYVGIIAFIAIAVLTVGGAVIADGIAIGVGAIAILALATRFFDFGSERSQASLQTISSGRLSYPIGYWNGLAILVALAVPLLLWRASRPGPAFRRALAAAPIPAITATIYLASSRGGVAVLVVGVVVFLTATHLRWRVAASVIVGTVASAAGGLALAHAPDLVDGPFGTAAARAQGQRTAVIYLAACVGAALAQYLFARLEPLQPTPRRALGALVVATVVVASLATLFSLHPVARANDFARPPAALGPDRGFVGRHLFAANGSGRWQLWSAAVDEWRTRPLLGRGAGSYYRWWLQHGSLPLQVRNAHSLYLETLGELGLVGLCLLLVALATGIWGGIARLSHGGRERHLAAALLGTYVAFLVGLAIEWIWQLAAVAAVGLAALGALVSASEEKRSSLRVWTLPRNLVVAVGVATSALMLIGFVYERRLSASYDAAARGDIAGALAAAADARAVEPWATPARLQLALLLERKGALDSADRELGAAIARMRQDWQLWLVRSRIELELGHGRQARAALRRAAALNPNSALFTGVSGR